MTPRVRYLLTVACDSERHGECEPVLWSRYEPTEHRCACSCHRAPQKCRSGKDATSHVAKSVTPA